MRPFLLLILIPALLPAAYLFDGTFSPSDWTQTVLSDRFASIAIDRSDIAGNPGDHARITVTRPSRFNGDEYGASSVYFRTGFSWRPSTDGPIDSVTISFSLINISSNAPLFLGDNFYFAAIRQGSNMWSATTFRRPLDNGGRIEYSVTITNPQTQTIGLGSFQNPLPPAFPPPFLGASAVPFEFGFRVSSESSVCNSDRPCVNATSVDSLDNFTVSINGAQPPADNTAIPEPGTMALAGFALAALAAKCRSTDGTHTDEA